MRLFAAAVPLLPEGLSSRLAEAAAGLGDCARAVRPENLHLTLAFLGEVPPEKVPLAAAALSSLAGSGPFRVKPGSTGTFPERGVPAVFWLGFSEGADRLKAAAAFLDTELRRSGFAMAGRDFTPHLTLARFRRHPPPVSLAAAAAAVERVCAGLEFSVSGAALWSSELSRGGPSYREICRTGF